MVGKTGISIVLVGIIVKSGKLRSGKVRSGKRRGAYSINRKRFQDVKALGFA
jgi:hypothetical protein